MTSHPNTNPGRLTAARIADNVVLLDDQANPAGQAGRLAVHTTQTPLHLAFSTYLFNDANEVLLTRRALGKKTWPGVWTNSCCGHPRPGESLEDAMRRRIGEELGAEAGPLEMVLPDFRYRAVDASGVVENEVCPVAIGRLRSALHPNPEEVMDVAWVPWDDLVTAITTTPQVYSPWSALQVPQMTDRVRSLLSARPAISPSLDQCLTDVEDLLAEEFTRLGQSWDAHATPLGLDVLPKDIPLWLTDQLRDGKRIRVVMSYWGFVVAGGLGEGRDYQTVVRIGAALEMLHLFALIHDDVMDGSTSRRGRPSAHVEAARWHQDAAAFGDSETFARNLAILAGDLCHMAADSLMEQVPSDVRAGWYDLCLELIVGQRGDLTGAAARRRDIVHAREVARLKSARYTITRPLQLGAMAAGAPDEIQDLLGRVGDEIGQAFAYRDDVLGAWGDPSLTGKPSGDDLAEGKATVILALAHERLGGPEADRMARLGTDSMAPDDVSHLQQALTTAGVRDRVEEMIAKHIETATTLLNTAGLTAEGVAGLLTAAGAAAWREQ